MGMQNTLLDLNNHLFAELERLGDEGLKGDRLKEECNRAKAISAVAGRIVSNAAVILNAKKLDLEYGKNEAQLHRRFSKSRTHCCRGNVLI